MSIPTPPRPSAGGSRPPAPHVTPRFEAPTLLQFWRSDARVMPGRRAPRWAGLIAFWLGLLSVALLGVELLFGVGDGVLGAVALPIGVVAGFFAIVALVAGIGRSLGFFGAVFALLGNVYVWAWLSEMLA
jgi:hypothetical protein